MPSQAKAEGWYVHDIITLEQYTGYMITLNYGETEIGFLLADADRKKQTGAGTESEV